MYLVILSTSQPEELSASGELVSDEFVEYDIRWGFISVGTSTLSHQVTGASSNGIVTVIDRMTANSHGWVSLIKKIDNTIESTRQHIGEKLLFSTVSKNLHQGSFRQDDYLRVDYASNTAEWENRIDGSLYSFPIPGGVTDYITMILGLRSMQWSEQPAITHHQLIVDRKVHDMMLAVIETGMVKTAIGYIPGVCVNLTSQSPELFSHNKPGDVWIASRFPVILSMDALTPVGRVRTMLTKWTINGIDMLNTFNETNPDIISKE